MLTLEDRKVPIALDMELTRLSELEDVGTWVIAEHPLTGKVIVVTMLVLELPGP